MIADEWKELRAAAKAAAKQLRTGPKEWPGTPSAPRLRLFLAASPDVILRLLHAYDTARGDVDTETPENHLANGDTTMPTLFDTLLQETT